MSGQSPSPPTGVPETPPAPQPKKRFRSLSERVKEPHPLDWAIAIATVLSAALMLVTWLDSRAEARRDQRPWVLFAGIDDVEGSPDSAVPPFRARVHVKNTGKSPALGVVTYSSLGYGAGNGKKPAGCAWPSEGGTPSLLPPDGTLAFDVSPAASGETAARAAKMYGDGAGIYISNRITYVDVFGKAHVTETCHYRTKGTPPGSWWFCADGNWADTP